MASREVRVPCVLCREMVTSTTGRDVCTRHRTWTTVVQVATGRGAGGALLEVFELTHTWITRDGCRVWLGTGEDRRRVIWEERAA